MDEESIRTFLRQMEHVSGHLWHSCSVTINKVMGVTEKLSKWWLQLSNVFRTRKTKEEQNRPYRNLSVTRVLKKVNKSWVFCETDIP